MAKTYDVNNPAHNTAYLIQREDDKVLKNLTEGEVKRMVLGTMPVRVLDGVTRFISIHNDVLLEQLRRRYYTKVGGVYKEKQQY